MKRFTCMIIAVFAAMAMFSATPAQRASVLNAGTQKQVFQNAGKVNAARSIDGKQIRKANKAASDYVVITDQPVGELKTYTRGGGHYYVSSQQLYYEDQSGTIDIVFAAENKVYFKDIVSGLAYGTWVEGTISADGQTITVPLSQNLRYVSSYDACVAIKLLNYTAGSGFSVDTEATNVTFSVADGVISMQGTGFGTVSLAGVWTDDGTIQNYGDYESVYTPYTQNKTLVTLPDGLTPTSMPMTGKFFASITDYQSSISTDINTNVKVAKDGNTFYIQGLVQLKPEAWVKGELADGEIEIPVTYLGADAESNDLYAMGYSSKGIVGVTLVYDATSGSMEVDGYVMVSTEELENTMSGIYEGLFIGERPELVVVPTGATIVEMPFNATIYDGSSSEEINSTVKVARDGSDVYIQGLSQEAPEGWIKGTFNAAGDTATFPYGQYVGVSTNYGCSMYLIGDDEAGENIADIVFAFDANKNLYTAQNVIYDNAKKDDFYYVYMIANAIIGTNCDGLWIAANQGYTNGQEVTAITISEEISGALAKNGNDNGPKYYESGTALRMYGDNTLTITSAQIMGKIVITMTGSADQKQLTANVGEYSLDGNEGTWTGEAKEVIFTVVSSKQARIQKIQIFYLDYSKTLVTVPTDLETSSYKFNGTDTYNNQATTFEVQVGFKGNDVYFQGLSYYLPEAWVKGTLADGIVTIPGWYLGVYESFFGDYDLVFGGATFAYNAEADKFTCAEYQTYAEGYAMDEYADITLTKLTEVAATPVEPQITSFAVAGETYPKVNFNISLTGTNGEDLLESKTSYIFFVQKGNESSPLELTTDLYTELEANMTEIPYTFSDDYDIYNSLLYLNQGETELRSWDKLGLQTIYRGAGEEHKSTINWFDVRAYWAEVDGEATAVENANVAVKAVKSIKDGQLIIRANGKIFNAQGVEIR